MNLSSTRAKVTFTGAGLTAAAVLALGSHQFMWGVLCGFAGLAALACAWAWKTPTGQPRGTSLAAGLAAHREPGPGTELACARPDGTLPDDCLCAQTRAEATTLTVPVDDGRRYGRKTPVGDPVATLPSWYVTQFEAGLQLEGWDPDHALAVAALRSLLAITPPAGVRELTSPVAWLQAPAPVRAQIGGPS